LRPHKTTPSFGMFAAFASDARMNALKPSAAGGIAPERLRIGAFGAGDRAVFVAIRAKVEGYGPGQALSVLSCPLPESTPSLVVALVAGERADRGR